MTNEVILILLTLVCVGTVALLVSVMFATYERTRTTLTLKTENFEMICRGSKAVEIGEAYVQFVQAAAAVGKASNGK